jgi:hypothetical protein
MDRYHRYVLEWLRRSRVMPPTTQSAIIRYLPRLILFTALCLLVAAFEWLVRDNEWLALLMIGFCIGAAAANLWTIRASVRVWPVWAEVVDFGRVESLLASNAPLPPVEQTGPEADYDDEFPTDRRNVS